MLNGSSLTILLASNFAVFSLLIFPPIDITCKELKSVRISKAKGGFSLSRNLNLILI